MGFTCRENAQRRTVALAACAALELSGCYYGNIRKLTYPSPQPSGGERAVYPGELSSPEAALSAGIGGFASLCRESIGFRGGTRKSVAFTAEGAQFRFQTPYTGETQMGCVSITGHIPQRGTLRFEIYVGGEGVVPDEPNATLEATGQSLTASAEVRDAPYAGGIEEAPAGATPMYPGAKTPLFKVSRQRLIFRFDRPCDPDAQYRLTVTGITVRGHPIRVPTVDFVTSSEWTPAYVD
jgi:hypothetical protein